MSDPAGFETAEETAADRSRPGDDIAEPEDTEQREDAEP
jgi:hypothetical protein